MAITISVKNMSGNQTDEFSIQDSFLEFEKGTQALHDTIVAYLAGQRAGSASTKNRAMVRGGGRKPFRQKGTGRARAGSIRSPLYVGGGVIFGPTPRSYAKKVNKKVKALALKRAFSERLKEENAVVIIDKLEIPDHKTRNIHNFLKTIQCTKSTLLVTEEYSEELLRATNNIPYLLLIKADSVNPYQLLRFHNIVFTKQALDSFLTRIGGNEK